jgi:hypothetical protein
VPAPLKHRLATPSPGISRFHPFFRGFSSQTLDPHFRLIRIARRVGNRTRHRTYCAVQSRLEFLHPNFTRLADERTVGGPCTYCGRRFAASTLTTAHRSPRGAGRPREPLKANGSQPGLSTDQVSIPPTLRPVLSNAFALRRLEDVRLRSVEYRARTKQSPTVRQAAPWRYKCIPHNFLPNYEVGTRSKVPVVELVGFCLRMQTQR